METRLLHSGTIDLLFGPFDVFRNRSRGGVKACRPHRTIQVVDVGHRCAYESIPSFLDRLAYQSDDGTAARDNRLHGRCASPGLSSSQFGISRHHRRKTGTNYRWHHASYGALGAARSRIEEHHPKRLYGPRAGRLRRRAYEHRHGAVLTAIVDVAGECGRGTHSRGLSQAHVVLMTETAKLGSVVIEPVSEAFGSELSPGTLQSLKPGEHVLLRAPAKCPTRSAVTPDQPNSADRLVQVFAQVGVWSKPNVHRQSLRTNTLDLKVVK
jgi:hypothetical protein